MSDGYIRLIPGDPRWQPGPEAAAAAVAYVERLFSGPADCVEQVRYEFYEQITLIDAGGNTTEVTCSSCGQEIDLGWFVELILDRGVSFDNLDVTVPCCGRVVPLDSLRYAWPIGFARFEVSAMNASRAKYELDAEELAELSGIIGHPIEQILAHY